MIKITRILADAELQFLSNKWLQTANCLNIPLNKSADIFKQITSAHSESFRAYHNLSHLYSMFQLAEKEPLEAPVLVELCIWFHDYIYDVKSGKNELKSANKALEILEDYCSKEDLITIYDLICSTKKHELTSGSMDQKYLLDIDLAVLGAPSAIYQQYVKAIRKEYGIFPDFLYYRGRKKAMNHFLERERIYFTDKFYESYEVQARRNIRSEL